MRIKSSTDSVIVKSLERHLVGQTFVVQMNYLAMIVQWITGIVFAFRSTRAIDTGTICIFIMTNGS